MSLNTSRPPPRRFERDTWWFIKHFIWPIAVRPYEHPEDFWFGSEELWCKGSKVSWKFAKLWLCYSLNTYCPLLLVVLATHIAALFIRPDIVDLFDFLDAGTFSGVMFYGGLVLAAIVGIIFVLEQLQKEGKQ